MLPNTTYSETDQQTWQTYFSEMERLWAAHSEHLHPWYRDNLKELLPFRDHIPSLEEIEALLAPIGWKAAYVDGLAPTWEIARMLHTHTMPVSRSIRSADEVFFSHEPDLIHDIFGHLPSILNPEYRRLLAFWTKAAALVLPTDQDRVNYALNKQHVESKGQIKVDSDKDTAVLVRPQDLIDSHHEISLLLLEKIYFWIFEFGIIRSRGGTQVLGAGLLTSIKEFAKLIFEPISFQTLDLESILAPYQLSSFQNVYYTANNVGDFEAILIALLTDFETYPACLTEVRAYA